MRLLHVITSLNPKGGGPAETLRQLAKVTQSEGLAEMEVVCFDPPSAPWLADFPVSAHALGPARGSFQYCAAYVPWLTERARGFDAVIVRGLWQYPGFATRRVLRPMGLPYFVFPHGMLDPWFKHTYPLKHLKKWLYWPWGEYQVLRDARAVLFTCEEERRLARESFWLYRCNERVVNYGTAAPAGDPDQQRELFLANYPGLRGKRLLLFLSRIHEKKGCDLLIRAFASVLAEHVALNTEHSPDTPPLHLVIAGPCADPRYLESLKHLATSVGLSPRSFETSAPGHTALSTSAAAPTSPPLGTDHCPLSTSPLTFLPMLSGDLKWGAFHAAAAFILPSHQENFGIAVVEALACGLPVLISDKVNIWREIEADRAGFVGSDTLEGTISLLSEWLSTPEPQRLAMQTSADHCFRTRFAIGSAARSLLTTIQDCLSDEWKLAQ